MTSLSQDKRSYVRLVMLASISLLVISLLAAISFVPQSSTPKARAATWTQIFADEFNGSAGTGVNTANWLYDTGTGFGTGEIETMTTSTNNVYQDGAGHLVIKAIRDASGNWTSGRIETQRSDFGGAAGGILAMEASIQQPNVSGAAGEGYWPAFWSLGAPYRVDHSWPKDGEIDILEDVNGLSSVYGTLHCGVASGGPCHETSGIGSGRQPCPGCQTSFHTYRVEVDRSVSPEQIRWYLDGANYFTINANQVDATTWANAVDHAFFIILDLAMGGGFPNGVAGHTTPTAATVSGGSMLVDYVRVFTANGSNPTPSPSPSVTPTGGSVQINSGGPAVAPFVADTGFTGGTTVVSTNSINTSGVSNPAPQAVYQSNRYGNFSYVVPGLTAGASYTVRLHFAETYWTAAGQRTFNVSINGQQVLTNFDIIASAGAANKATVQQFTATADSSGKITLQFTTVKDNAQVNGIEVIPATAPPPATTQINSGGPAVAPFAADTDFTGGTAVSTTKTVDTSGVSNPAPQAVYQSNRYGNFSYAVPGLTAGKSYTVRLHFAETYWTAAGQRTFNVSINGQQVLTNFDIVAAAGGANKATVQQFTATADSSGKITIQFTTVKDNAQVNGIEIS
ncbi:MAG: family 16 glycosylhydrolase [Ktedonobacteraceae bacterium]|nr:family 16 glycosylhydrolase [Ktedonobacteraceae bacterium]